VARFAALDLKLEFEASVIRNGPQECVDPRPYLVQTVFSVAHRLPPLGFFDFAAGVTGPEASGGNGMDLLMKYCCTMPTRLLVSQYNTSPLDTL
jgi:hypothetical protein